MTHDFTLVLYHGTIGAVTGPVTELTHDLSDALFAAGCDDATPCQRGGRVYLRFSREAPNLIKAFMSAVRNVVQAGYVGMLWVDDEPPGLDDECKDWSAEKRRAVAIGLHQARTGQFAADPPDMKAIDAPNPGTEAQPQCPTAPTDSPTDPRSSAARAAGTLD